MKVTSNRLFGDVLPGDINAKGLKGAGLGMALRQLQEGLIGIGGFLPGARREYVFQFDRAGPVLSQFGFGCLKGGVGGQRRIESHVALPCSPSTSVASPRHGINSCLHFIYFVPGHFVHWITP